jgi:PAS domain S-box-containing protein
MPARHINQSHCCALSRTIHSHHPLKGEAVMTISKPGNILLSGPAHAHILSQAADLREAGWQVRHMSTPGDLQDMLELPQPFDLLLLHLDHQDGLAWVQSALGLLEKRPAPLVCQAGQIDPEAAARLAGHPDLHFLPENAGGSLVQAVLQQALQAHNNRQSSPPGFQAQIDTLSRVIESSQEVIFVIDAGYRLVLANPAFQAGWQAAGGRPLAPGDPVFAPGYLPELWQTWKGHFERALSGEEFSVRAAVQWPDGEHVMESTLTPLHDRDHRVTGVLMVTHDISEHVRLQQELEQRVAQRTLELNHSELRLREVLDSSINALFKIDLIENRFEYLNPAFERMTGLTLEEGYRMPGMGLLELVHPEDRPAWQQVIRDLAAHQGESREVEFRLLHRERGYLWFLNRFLIHYNAQGRPQNMFGSVVEITQRKAAEQALQESETRYRLLFENMQQGFALHELVFDESGQVEDIRFLAVNAAYERHTGLNPERLVGRKMQEVMPGALSPMIEQYKRVALTGAPVDLEYYAPAIQRHLRVRAFSPQRNRFAMIVEDITGQVLAAQALRESEEKYRALFNNDIIAITISEAATNQILDVNEAAVHMFGFNREELLSGMTILDLAADPPLAAADLEALSGTPNTFYPKHWARTRDGQVFPIEIASGLFTWRGAPVIFGMIRNISDRVQAEQALRESEEKYRVLFQNMGEGFSLVEMVYDEAGQGVDFRYLEVNAAYEAITGFSPAQVVGRTTGEIIPDISPEQLAGLVRAAQGGAPLVFEVFLSARQRHLRVRAFTPQPGRFAAMVEDITERVQAEQALRESEEKYRMLFQNRVYAVTISDAETHVILDANEAATHMFGYTREELLSGMTMLDMADDPDQVNLDLGTSSLDAPVFFPLQWAHTRDGRRFPVEVAGGMYTWGGVPVNYTLFHDISNRLQAEQAQRESDAILQSFFDGVQQSMGIFRVLPEINDLEYLRMNRVAMKDLYILPQDLPGAQAGEHGMSAISRRLWLEECLHCQETGQPVQFEYQRDVYPGMWLLVSLNTIDAGVFSFVAMDISDLKHLQNELEQLTGVLEKRVALRTAELSQANRELKEALRLREEFLHNLSHELRTPLTGILGLTEALQSRVYGELSPRQDKALVTLAASGQRLLKLVNNLLEMSLLLAGKVTLQPAMVHLDSLLQSRLQLIQSEVERKHLQVELPQGAQPEYLLVDAHRLGLMLGELLENAVKFTPEGGRIGLEFAADTTARVTRWTVWDTGIGISPDLQAQLFQLFVQGESGLKRPYEGLGMGLALVSELVKLHRGNIQVQSTLKEGSRFTVILPWMYP